MKQQVTSVIFREEKDGNILAVFPYVKENEDKVLCYSPIGQHSIMSWDYFKKTKPVKRVTSKVAKIIYELGSFGYQLRIINRYKLDA